MASSDKELEQQLMEAGTKLVNPPSSVDELLPLLNQVENCLAKVEQSPTKSMQSALAPSLTALVAEQLFRHSDVDVKVAVASCISEITRITAPDAPYDDDQMKDVFQLIVSSFENLADQSSRSYNRRTSILETVAKIRSCVVMLDLECDALIIEMFQHFLNAISSLHSGVVKHYASSAQFFFSPRDDHPENIFSSMETIMTLVLEESEDISPELLSPLLASVKRGNEEVLPVARKLGEKVLENCATKVKPYLQHAVKSLGISLDEYNEIVFSICQEISGTVEQTDVHATDEVQNDAHAADENQVEESNPAGESLNEAAQVEEGNPAGESLDEAGQTDKELAAEAGSPKQADPVNENSPKSVVSNGVVQTGEDSLADLGSLKKQDDGNHADQLKSIDMSCNVETNILDTEKPANEESKPANEESKPERAIRKRGRKLNTSVKLTEPSESSHIGAEKEAEKILDDGTHSKNVPGSPCEEPSVEATVSSENKKEAGSSQPSSPKALEVESMTVASPSGSGGLLDESLPKKAAQSKKKESFTKDSEPSSDAVLKKASEGISDTEAKPNKRSARKAPAKVSNEEKSSIVTDASKKESGTVSESEAKPLKQSSKMVDATSNDGDESSLNQTEDKKHRSRGKSIPEKNVTRSSTKDDDKEKVSSPKLAAKLAKHEHQLEEMPKVDSKRKHASGNEKASGTREYDASLVGLRVKVWWPKDRTFYEGVISSYDAVKKKHEVAYDDGDTEILNLKREKWEIIEDESAPDEGESTDPQSPDVPSERPPPKKKLKTNPDQSTKQGKVDASPLRAGGGSSSKTKSAATKSGRRSKEVGKTDGKSTDDSKIVKKQEDDNVGKTKDNTNKSGSKSAEVTSKTASKSKNDDITTTKTGKFKDDGMRTPNTSKSKQEATKTGRSKQETPKVSSNAKGKSPRSGGKSSVNGTGKLKSGSSKVKNVEDKENSSDSEKAQESTKGKSVTASKGQGSEAKSGKKRRRV
ncbi:altered inheritance of mitochondria protein 21 isoform X3 [Manihot esculenta]|nr:altered inheritance of mitochondria protein 21 isoform X3 [Manihot esculenta]